MAKVTKPQDGGEVIVGPVGFTDADVTAKINEYSIGIENITKASDKILKKMNKLQEELTAIEQEKTRLKGLLYLLGSLDMTVPYVSPVDDTGNLVATVDEINSNEKNRIYENFAQKYGQYLNTMQRTLDTEILNEVKTKATNKVLLKNLENFKAYAEAEGETITTDPMKYMDETYGNPKQIIKK